VTLLVNFGRIQYAEQCDLCQQLIITGDFNENSKKSADGLSLVRERFFDDKKYVCMTCE
jgi:hypothetical protein